MTRLNRIIDAIRAVLRGVVVTLAALVCVAVIVVGIGAAIGYRPVLIQTGSMGDAAPPGSLIVASPDRSVEVGDVLVMRTDGRATVTHRVVDVEASPAGPVAITRGDANSDVDPVPYALGDEELTARWVVADAGGWLAQVRGTTIGLSLLLFVIGSLCFVALRRIWRPQYLLLPPPEPGTRVDSDTRPERARADHATPDQPETGRGRRRRGLLVAASVGVAATVAGTAFSLYVGVDSVGANAFSTLPCFDARLGSVQKGQHTNSSAGTAAIPITAVDPTKSFLVFSASSNSNEADESIVMGELASATSIEFTRNTDNGAPSDVVVEWSVVEYDCGISVQRGRNTSTGTASIDASIAGVDTASSFALLNGAPTAGDDDVGDEMSTVELFDATTLRITSSSNVPAGTEFAWQVVTFDAGDALTQQLDATLLDTESTATITLPTTVDPASTAIFATARWTGTGVDIGDRAVRASLVDGDTVEVFRSISDDQVDLVIQVVEFTDGTTVRHGVLDLAAAELADTVTIPGVEVARSTVLSTVHTPFSASGGSTDASLDDVIGEASARMTLLDAQTVEVARDASTGAASFAWQAITWNGPGWANPDAPFRQRIDVDAGTVDAPNGYTTSLTIDHAALVNDTISTTGGDDVQIWHHNGTTWAELHRVLDDDSAWNAADTTIRFRTRAAIAASDTGTYWLYFGDDTPAAPLDDPSEVYLVTEGFDDGTLGRFDDRTGGTAWYDDDPWTQSITIAIDGSALSGPVADHSVLVRITDSDLTAHAQADGSDFRFMSGDGTTQLAHQIEEWDPGADTLTAWVRVPSVSTTSTDIHLHFGSPTAPDQSSPRATWADESAVWFLAGDPAVDTPALDDESPQQRDGVAIADAAATTTPVGPGVALDGTLDRLESQPFSQADAPFTVSTMVRADTLASDATILAQGDPSAGGLFDVALIAGGSPSARVRLNVDGTVVTVAGGSIATGTWHHIAASWDRSTLTLYVDGIAVGSTPTGGPLAIASPTPVVIGGDAAGSATLDGVVGHAQISADAWSPDRVRLASDLFLAPGSVIAATAASPVTAFEQGSWSTRSPLVVDSARVAGPLSDYPLLVEFTDAAIGASARADGDDLVFTDADGTTRLDHWIESWDPATGALTAWVRVPVLDDAADTTIYVYSGNATASDQQDVAGVWGDGADFVAANSSS